MKKVLILTYYWPPSGGAGVQRWLKFVKYLPEFGIEPVVYTHSNGEIPSIDESLLKEVPDNLEVLKTEIWEPYSVYKKLTGKKEKVNTAFLTEEKTKSSLMNGFAVWVRGNLFIPDARKYWIKPSVKYLSKYLENQQIDTVISTGPPHTMHLIAMQLKEKFGLKWIADFRDPWTNIDFYKDLKLSKQADKKHRLLEQKVLNTADLTISVGPTLSDELKGLGAKKVKTITNGFDQEDVIQTEVALDDKISIAHIGSFTKTRNPEILLDVLVQLFKERPEMKPRVELKLVGKVDYQISELIKKKGLESIVRKIDYIPHSEVILEQKKSHFLLLVVNDTPNAKGILTGKVFEYLAARRPILAIAPKDGDLAQLIEESHAGVVIDKNNSEMLKDLLIEYFHQPEIVKPYCEQEIDIYSRKNLTSKLAQAINEL